MGSAHSRRSMSYETALLARRYEIYENLKNRENIDEYPPPIPDLIIIDRGNTPPPPPPPNHPPNQW